MVEKPICDVWNAQLPLGYYSGTAIDASRGARPSCRAFRLVGDSLKFLFLRVPRSYPGSKLRLALKSIIQDGLTIEFRIGQGNFEYLKFAFLGFTESTLKSGQIILLQKRVNNADTTPHVSSVLLDFGDLQDVFRRHGPGKYVARLGLSFSATIQSVNPTRDQVARIEDDTADDGKFGQGTVLTREHVIRRGGIKGLLVAYPDDKFDTICRMNKIRIPEQYKFVYRPSMLKYRGGPTHIEINGISEAPKRSRLSLPIIVILALKELIKLHLRSIEMIAYDRREALNYIEGDLDAEGDGFYQDLYEMLLAGHSLNEPYLRKMLRDYQRVQRSALKEKLNVNVQCHFKKSCYVYGVVDELGVLGEDEVYIHLPQREGVLVSEVLIARLPSHKPSDVRLMKAVSKPELHFLSNCIVFPRTGRYSIPGSMSGGDLDGDVYFVCWEPTIFPRRTVWPDQASSQSTNPSVDWSRRNLNAALVELFVEQRHNNLLGRASMEWQSVVESYFRMAGAQYSMKLAEIIEEALDILKSGGSYTALWDRYNTILSEYCVESENMKQRGSKLRKLRNLIPSIEEYEEVTYSRAQDQDLILRDENCQDWWDCYQNGRDLIEPFNKGLALAKNKDVMEQNEGISRRRGEDGPTHVETYITRFVNKHFPRASDSILGKNNRMSYIQASAWYAVGYERDRPAFAWLGARFLNNIKSYTTNEGRPGLSVGPLKRLQDIDDFRDPTREIWLLRRRVDNNRTSVETAFTANYINQLQLDSDESEQSEDEFSGLEMGFIGFAEVVPD
ncbi:RdRP-domain-containing protein [Sanghuangporus baumii]|uniref:RNA-dependent RNA polymerase n=1 Tax=Sanghuangporus baumii TaxID=108892 RepID=A0A9Q5HYG5_SANBA|nr:RdRP-domain-containing protein [Sanghuangporus baumii]